MEEAPFDSEFHVDFDYLTEGSVDELPSTAKSRMREFAAGCDDLVGAAVAVERAGADETPHDYRAQAVVYARPIAGEGKGQDIVATLHDALDAVETQMRERRERPSTPWKQP